MVSGLTIEAGSSYPLGATPVAGGVNFALVSERAQRVELCLYDASGEIGLGRLDLPSQSGDVWHGFVPALDTHLSYGYRVHGPYEPESGLRFNANKLLLDPYAKSLAGRFSWCDSHFGYDRNDPLKDLSFSNSDNAQQMVKGRIIADHPARITERPWIASNANRTIYELHAKGFSQGFEQLEERARGTLAALAQPEVIKYLKALGVTTLELLPIHAFINDYFLHQRGLTNYWGYNTLGFFAPHQAYLNSSDPFAFRQMIDQLHLAGFEVVLDVVYNHSAESDELGPTLSLRGIDNSLYYRLAEDKRLYVNDTGCGNTLNLDHPRVVQLIMDSLRYWHQVQGVDGFRFDLASVLARRANGFDPSHPLLQAIAQDPQLQTALFIAEPWDIGPGGYQLGAFPRGWLEWNDRYRDTVRRFWRGDMGVVPEFAKRVHGSADIFEANGRRPTESLNFITSHDGFTLCDWVSYEDRHNLANGEQNRDGHHENYSCNWGVEGDTSDPAISATRDALQRAMLMTLFLSQGTPMLLAGDERSRTQQGNNNAYCQDNEINWVDWSDCNETPAEPSLRAFVAQLTEIRRTEPLLGCPDYIHNPESHEERATLWYNSQGEPLSSNQWEQPDLCHLGYLLRGRADESTLYIIFNRAAQPQRFVLPTNSRTERWKMRLCSVATATLDSTYATGAVLELPAQSVTLFSALH